MLRPKYLSPRPSAHPDTVCLYSMWAAVEFTHNRGVKLRPGTEHPRGVLAGELTSYTLGDKRLEAIALKPGPHGGDDLAVIYRPRFVGVGTDVFRISGLERVGDPPAWVHQEWICRPQPRPAHIAGEPTRFRRP
jgi:hypothetical protein